MPIKRDGRWGVRIFDPVTHGQVWLGTYCRKKDAELREREAERDLNLVFKPTARRAFLPDLILHDLRHTYASALTHNGQSMKYGQTVMGHASAQTTLDVYGHLFEKRGNEAPRLLEEWLASPPDQVPAAAGERRA
jgi:integrase